MIREIADIPINVLGDVAAHLENLRAERRDKDAARLQAIRARVAAGDYAPCAL